MNKKTKEKILSQIGISEWNQIKTTAHFEGFISNIEAFSDKDIMQIVWEMRDPAKLTEDYFEEMINTVFDYDPNLMYELIDSKEYLIKFIENIDFNGKYVDEKVFLGRLAEGLRDYFHWYEVETNSRITDKKSDYETSVSQTLNILRRNDALPKDKREDIKVLYDTPTPETLELLDTLEFQDFITDAKTLN